MTQPQDPADGVSSVNPKGEQAREEHRPSGGAPDSTGELAPGGHDSVDSPASTQTGTTDSAEPKSARATEPPSAAPPAAEQPEVGELAVPAPPAPLTTGVERAGMFGAGGSGDTSGYGLLRRAPYTPAATPRPYGGYFDAVADALLAAMAERGIPVTAIEQTTVAYGEITFYLQRDHLQAMLWAVRDDPALRFELLSSLSGVDYGSVGGAPGGGPGGGPADGPHVARRLHVVYEMTSMTYRRRIRLEVAVDVADPYLPTAVPVYPTADWHERETYDMFGIVFAGHPALTRILMPDDWDGHPQRKDYPLGGIAVEYKGAEIAPPDERRVYS